MNILDCQRAKIESLEGALARARAENLRRNAEIERLRALAKRLSDALLTIRPLGGSEMFIKSGEDFYADPDYCKQLIAEIQQRAHQGMIAQVRLSRLKPPASGGQRQTR